MAKKIEEQEKDSENLKKRKHQYQRQTFFPMACHYNLDIPVSKIIHDEKNEHGLKYL